MKLYEELAEWWPLISAPEEYAEEAVMFAVTFDGLAARPIDTMLELGSGGGNNASYLKRRYRMTLVDASEQMIAVSRALNPDVEHLQGDMRTVRLGRTFDAVFIHDAIMHLTTREDVTAAIRTAAEHLVPGGVALFVPDDTAETYTPATTTGGNDGEERSARYLMWEHPARGETFEVDMVYVLRDGDDVRVEHESWPLGLFARATWLRLIEAAGLEARAMPAVHSTYAPHHGREIFAGVKPA